MKDNEETPSMRDAIIGLIIIRVIVGFVILFCNRCYWNIVSFRDRTTL